MKTPEELRSDARSYRIEAAWCEAEAARLERVSAENVEPWHGKATTNG